MTKKVKCGIVISMPSINLQYLKYLKAEVENYPNFIETGTYLGGTIFSLEPHFKNLYTIELDQKLFQNAKLNYRGNKITFIQGDSSSKLPEILPNIKGRSIIFLDGHWSCGVTARGDKDCPLYEELDAVMNFHQEDCIVIIDDARHFNLLIDGEVDWSEITEKGILDVTKLRRTHYHYLPSELDPKDRLILYLDKSS